jgi:ribosome-associated protein
VIDLPSRHGVRALTAKKATKAAKAKKAPAKKPAAKKAPVKKSSAKKVIAKKTPAKKVVAKKASARKAAPNAVKTVAKKPVAKTAAPKIVKPVKVAAKKAPAAKPGKVPVKNKAARKPKAPKPVAKVAPQSDLLKRILVSLDDDKAENIVTVDLDGRGAIADAAVIASGRSSRHVAAIADHLARKLKEGGYGTRPVSGAATGDWVLVDAGDVIVHLFRPEVREYYDLEGMWNVGSPAKD